MPILAKKRNLRCLRINRIPIGAFAENTKYHKIYIPENVTSIGEHFRDVSI